jgi:DNA-directed RNA polymerase specialized sigma24 family protein
MAETDFAQFVGARTAALLRLAYLLTGESHAAEDIVQEALIRAHRRWPTASTTAGSPHTSWRTTTAAGQ